MSSFENDNIDTEIAEIAEHVDVIVESDNPHLDNIFKVLEELRLEDENLIMKENEQMDKIWKSSFDFSKEIEKLEDVKQSSISALTSANANESEAAQKHVETLGTLTAQEKRLSAIKVEIDKVKAESKEIHSRAENVPKLSQNKKLYYSLSRITLDKTVSDEEVKGFVVNPRKDDVHAFDFKLSDDQVMGQNGVSNYFVSNYLWDLIAAAADPKWEQV